MHSDKFLALNLLMHANFWLRRETHRSHQALAISR